MVKLIPFPDQSVVVLGIEANKNLPDAEKAMATITWPTYEEDAKLPELVYETKIRPTKDDPNATARLATDESLGRFGAHILRHHVPELRNIEGVSRGEDLLSRPKDAVEEIILAIIIAFRAGPNALLEKKTG
jgi:hypothetical protein